MSETFVDDQLALGQYGVSSLRTSLSQYIDSGRLKDAISILKELGEKKALETRDFDTLKCLQFWLLQEEVSLKYQEGIDRATFLEECWRNFEDFVAKYYVHAPFAISRLKITIGRILLKNYLQEYQRRDQSEDVELIFKITYYKTQLGETEDAIEALKYIKNIYPDDMDLQMRLAYSFYKQGCKDKIEKKAQGNTNENTDKNANASEPSFRMQGLKLFREVFLHIAPFDWNFFFVEDFFYCVTLMRSSGYREEEIKWWLPTVAMREDLFFGTGYTAKQLIEVESSIDISRIDSSKIYFDEAAFAKNIYRMQYFVTGMSQVSTADFATVEQLKLYQKKRIEISDRLEHFFSIK